MTEREIERERGKTLMERQGDCVKSRSKMSKNKLFFLGKYYGGKKRTENIFQKFSQPGCRY